ncbi:hypothetical protein SR870_01480 [Rhodopseudomonas palustris]|nr:hypothetical protein [Rhodopseudomonas palustris]WQG99992.1 hypothetical protein SR870_01480 [Rhodopseudomonas palustris]
MNRFDPAAADQARPAIRDIAARQTVCAALALGILAIAVRIAAVW